MATADIGKLRQVLDYWSCETCLDAYTPEQDYFCGICARLNREVLVRKVAVGTDEAVQVIPQEEFNLAQNLKDRTQQQEQELAETRARVAHLQARETELEDEVRLLKEERERAPPAPETPPEPELVSFEFVGIRKDKPAADVVEFTEEPEEEPTSPWEAGPSVAEPAPAETAEEPAPPTAPEEPPAFEAGPAEAEAVPETFRPERAAKARPRQPAADDALERIEAEIAKIEEELGTLTAKERQLSGSTQTTTSDEERVALRRTGRRRKR